MASSQQQKFPPPPPPPQPQKQNVTVRSKVYTNKYLGIKHGSVKLVDSAEIWEKVGFVIGVQAKAEGFVLVKNGKALAHGDVPGEGVYLVDYSPIPSDPKPTSTLWTQLGDAEFEPISTPGGLYLDIVDNKLVVNTPRNEDSQLWKTTPLLT